MLSPLDIELLLVIYWISLDTMSVYLLEVNAATGETLNPKHN